MINGNTIYIIVLVLLLISIILIITQVHPLRGHTDSKALWFVVLFLEEILFVFLLISFVINLYCF